MEKTKIRFIINPISGTKGKQAIVDMLPRCLDGERQEWDIEYTRYAGHAAKLAAAAVEESIDVVVAVGGDGTVNEVACSLVHTPAALGIIPCGSGNGLARHLGIPMHPEGALRIINECCIEQLDYGRINEHPFFCTCGVGFDADVSDRFAKAGKRGLLTYIENTLQIGFNYKPELYEITIDGQQQTHRAFLIACGNASQYGNNAYIAPSASMSDGLMNVTLMEPFNVLEGARIAMQLFNKNLENNPYVKTFLCRHLHIHRERPGVVHFDGDPMECGADLDVELIAGGIRMVVNPQPQRMELPILRTFTDIYENLSQEIERTNRHIKRINADLLNRLRR